MMLFVIDIQVTTPDHHHDSNKATTITIDNTQDEQGLKMQMCLKPQVSY